MLNSVFADASAAAERWPAIVCSLHRIVGIKNSRDSVTRILCSLINELRLHSGPLLQFANEQIPAQMPVQIGDRTTPTAHQMSLRLTSEFYDEIWKSVEPLEYINRSIDESLRSDPTQWPEKAVAKVCQELCDFLTKADAERLSSLVVNERKIVERIEDRRQADSAAVEKSETAESRESGQNDIRSDIKAPDRDQRKAYILWWSGKTQAEVAEEVFGSREQQYKVSRAKTTVENYFKSCGIPEERWRQESEKPCFITMDPSKINLGQRHDGHTKAQREEFDDSD